MLQKLIHRGIFLVLVLSTALTACNRPVTTTDPVTLTTTTVTTTTEPSLTSTSTTSFTPTSTSPTHTTAKITTTTPILPHLILIAASDSSSQWKSLATVICDGKSDQLIINKYLITGHIIELGPGTFNCDGTINLQANIHMYGQGDTTIINCIGGGIYVHNVDNVELDHFKITGAISLGIIPASLYIDATTSDHSGFSIHDIKESAKGGFLVSTSSHQISNVVFANCDSSHPDGMGFFMDGDGFGSLLQDFIFYDCTVENAGTADTRYNDWVTGFDFAEGDNNLTVNRLSVIKCSVNGAWESDFHLEGAPTVYNMVYTGCSATNAGEKVGGALFGAGFLVNGTTQDVVYNGNTTSSNANGDINAWNGSSYTNVTPIQNEIYPVGSSKTASGVTQGNCSGVIINTDSTHKELVLYSNNGNLVNQQIELGATYIGDDGNTYTLNDTKIVAQFTNYAVIRLTKLE